MRAFSFTTHSWVIAAALVLGTGFMGNDGRVTGLASWYGGGERLNRYTASGSRMHPDALEAAMWDVPFGSLVNVTNRDTGRAVTVRITDRGPSKRFFPKRVIDLSRAAFEQLAPLRRGLILVDVELVPPPGPPVKTRP